MSSMIRNRTSLPISHSDDKTPLRRRLSSLSLNLNPIPSPATSWTAFRRSKSVSAIHRWWDWVMSRKPIFTQDLEMNEHEASALGSNSRGTVKHLFYKIKSEITRLLPSADKLTLPQTYRYENFDARRRS